MREHQLLKTAPAITAWLDHYGVKNYHLLPDKKYGYVVDVEGHVSLSYQNLSTIGVKFNDVKSHFACAKNNLISLLGCPQNVGGNFACFDNQLTSLEFCPSMVGESFCCNNNALLNLEFCPQIVKGVFVCSFNPDLGDTQEIIDFAKIYSIHSVFLNIKKEKEKLSKAINSQLQNKSPFKI